MIRRAFARLMGKLVGMPPGAASHLAEIASHIERILGEPKQHLHESYSPDIHVDLIHYAPAADRDFHYLVTSGMSDRPMPDGSLLELTMALPAHWQISAEGFKDRDMWQPVLLLKQLARYPITYRTVLAKGHTVFVGDVPALEPMKAVFLMSPVLVAELRNPLRLADGRQIEFLSPYLLHQAELDLKLEDHLEELFEKFGEHEVTELYDLSRPSAV